MTPADLTAVTHLGSANQWLAIVSVARGDGSVHASLVNAGVLAHPVDGEQSVALVVRGDARKLSLLRANRRATVSFHHGWEWVSVEGTVDVVGPDDPLAGVGPDDIPELLRAVFRSAGGRHDNWAEYDRTMVAERRAAVLVRPERVLTNRSR